MNVNFEYYKIFYYVARYHNFTKAAKVLGNSQPNVTRAMNCLEQQLEGYYLSGQTGVYSSQETGNSSIHMWRLQCHSF